MISPPTAAFPDPTTNATWPAALFGPRALLVVIATEPELPTLDVPVFRMIFPLTPSPPALAVDKINAPLVDDEL
jgi:hypothetical protein